MQSSARFLFILASFLFTHYALAQSHFTEIYKDQEVWRVDHFKAFPGKLQEFVDSKSFYSLSKAKEYSANFKSTNKLKNFLVTTTEKAALPLWEVKHEWSQDWEDKYADWIGENLNKDFFLKYNLSTDCADVAYALRWIFARNNNLPAAATLAGSGANATHLSAKKEWNSLPTHKDWHEDQRFLAALNWLLENVFTKTLYKDTFPIEINKITVRPGLINLLGGHTEVFRQVSYNPSEIPLEVVSSTMPRAVRELAVRPFLDTEVTGMEDGGLLRFRWPEMSKNWQMIPKENMPFYSLEQYGNTLCEDESRFAFCMFKLLGMSYDPELILTKLQDGILSIIKQREEVVNSGFIYCQSHDCAPGTQAWEDWSTPTRDGRLQGSLKSAFATAQNISLYNEFIEWAKKEKILLSEESLSIEDFYLRLSDNFVSHDPRDGIDVRWAANPVAILKHVSKLVFDTQHLRDELIVKAKPCRDNPLSCQNSKNLFQEFSTLEMDFKVRESISSWWKFCRDEKCPEDKLNSSLFKSIWFQSSLPWDSVELRTGSVKSQGHLLNASVVQPGGKRFVILDYQRLYDVERRVEFKQDFKQEGMLYFDDYTKQFLRVSSDGINLFDEDFELTAQIALNEWNNTGLVLHRLGAGKIFFSRSIDQDSPSFPPRGHDGWIFDLVTKKVSEKMSFDYIWADDFDGKKILLIGRENKLIQLVNDAVQIQLFPSIPGLVLAFLHLGSDKFLLGASEGEGHVFYEVHDGKVNRFFKVPSNFISVSRINSHYLFIETFSSDQSTYLMDANLNFHYFGQNLLKGYTAGIDQQFMFRKSSNHQWTGIYLDGTNMIDTPIKLNTSYPAVTSASENWFSLAKDNSFEVQNYEGETLSSHPFRSHAVCNGLLNGGVCLGKVSFKAEVYFSPLPSASEFSVMRIGLGPDWRVKEPLATVMIKEQATPSQDYFSFSEPKLRFGVFTGTGIALSYGVTLWFPDL